MSSGIAGKSQRNAVYGTKIERAQSSGVATANLFQVTGGRVLVTTIVGEVTGTLQAIANAAKLQAANTALTSFTDLSATVDLNGALAGFLFGITGVPANPAIIGMSVPQNNEIIVQTGFVRLNAVTTSTGNMKWTLTYIPLDDGASVTAV